MLSGGERQRLALARLWFQDTSIVILDEATSAMDNLTEEYVMHQVLEGSYMMQVLEVFKLLTFFVMMIKYS